MKKIAKKKRKNLHLHLSNTISFILEHCGLLCVMRYTLFVQSAPPKMFIAISH